MIFLYRMPANMNQIFLLGMPVRICQKDIYSNFLSRTVSSTLHNISDLRLLMEICRLLPLCELVSNNLKLMYVSFNTSIIVRLI